VRGISEVRECAVPETHGIPLTVQRFLDNISSDQFAGRDTARHSINLLDNGVVSGGRDLNVSRA
jgi:hypothetical protein